MHIETQIQTSKHTLTHTHTDIHSRDLRYKSLWQYIDTAIKYYILLLFYSEKVSLFSQIALSPRKFFREYCYQCNW